MLVAINAGNRTNSLAFLGQLLYPMLLAVRILALLSVLSTAHTTVTPLVVSVEGTTACYEEIDFLTCSPAATVYMKMQPNSGIIHEFNVEGGNVPDWPLAIDIQRLPSKFDVSCGMEAMLHQAYELFEFDYACALGLQIGGCYNASTMPPSSSAEDNYVLCCIDSPRGTGRHCLRYDYDDKYFLYECIVSVQSYLNVTLNINGSLVSFVLSNTYEEYQIVEAELIATPWRQILNTLHQGRPSNDLLKWYRVSSNEKFLWLTLSTDTWRAAAKCDGALHDATATDMNYPRAKRTTVQGALGTSLSNAQLTGTDESPIINGDLVPLDNVELLMLVIS